MNYKRIIPRLDIKDHNLVKGINLEGLRVLGKPDFFAKIYTDGKNYQECFFIWNNDEYDKSNGQDPDKYKIDCADAVAMWGTVVHKPEKWTSKDTDALSGLLEKFIETEKNQSKVGIASSLLKAIE